LTELLTHDEINTQEKLDAIIKAFRRLPSKELERLGIDLNHDIIEGNRTIS